MCASVMKDYADTVGAKFVDVKDISTQDHEQLEEQHLWFACDNPPFKGTQANANFAENRAIVYSDDKKFFMWINDDDHVKVARTSEGFNLVDDFNTVSNTLAKLEEQEAFEKNDKLGYLTTKAFDLGAGMRATVQCRLPRAGHWGKADEKVDEINEKHNAIVSNIRNADGSKTEFFEVTNGYQLGRSEAEQIQAVLDAVNDLLDLELSLPEAPKGVLVGKHLNNYLDLGDELPQFPDGTKSLLSKHLTQQVWDELHEATDNIGFAFKHAIFTGCKNVDSGIGVYAGSADSYRAFAPLLDKIIEDYHGHGRDDKHIFDMDYNNLNCPPFPEDEDAMILSTRIRVARNLEGFPFGGAIQ